MPGASNDLADSPAPTLRCPPPPHPPPPPLPGCRTTSVQNLMYVKEDIILPHTVTFYDLIINKAQVQTPGAVQAPPGGAVPAGVPARGAASLAMA